MALVKYNNNSISAITAAASIPTGAMNLITTNTIGKVMKKFAITFIKRNSLMMSGKKL